MAIFHRTYRALRRLRRDQRGFGAMELALSLPFILFLCLGMIDAFGMVAKKIDFERAAQQTTDLALAKRPNSSDGTYLKPTAAVAAGTGTDSVSIDIYLECDGVRQSNFNTTCASGEIPARFVGVEISASHETRFDWAAFAKIFGFRSFTNSVQVTGDSLVRIQ